MVGNFYQSIIYTSTSFPAPPFASAVVMEGDIQMSARMMQRNAIRSPSQKWHGGVVPYVVDYSFSEAERGFIGKAFEIYQAETCIRFVPNTGANNYPDYVHLVKGYGCSSSIGRVGGRQEVSLGQGCIYTGIILHELMHALGKFLLLP